MVDGRYSIPNMNETPELLPCPFCAQAAWLRDGLPFVVECPACGATGPEGLTAARAIERWNTRPYRLAVEAALNSLTPSPLVIAFFRPR